MLQARDTASGRRAPPAQARGGVASATRRPVHLAGKEFVLIGNARHRNNSLSSCLEEPVRSGPGGVGRPVLRRARARGPRSATAVSLQKPGYVVAEEVLRRSLFRCRSHRSQGTLRAESFADPVGLCEGVLDGGLAHGVPRRAA